MTNKALLTIIAILLLGVLSVSVIRALDNGDDTSTFEDISNNIDEAGEELRDEIDDHTDDR